MFQVTRQLTNVRPKDDQSTLVCGPTTGVMKISPAAAALIGVSEEDYLAVTYAKVLVDGVEQEKPFLFKGQAKNEETKTAQVGSKLSYTNNPGGPLQFSSGNAWNELGGDTENNTKFKVHGAEPEDFAPIESDGVIYYMVEYVGKEPKTEKKPKGENEAEASAAAIADMGAASED